MWRHVAPWWRHHGSEQKAQREREREKEKIMPIIMATLLLWRTHSARTNIYHRTVVLGLKEIGNDQTKILEPHADNDDSANREGS